MSEQTLFKFGKLKIEANWNEDVQPAKKFKITIGDKTEILDRQDLYSLMMLFGDEDQQCDLIPVVETKVVMVKRLLKIRAKKNIKRGELINTTYEYPMAETVYDKLKFSQDLQLSNKQIDKHFIGVK